MISESLVLMHLRPSEFLHLVFLRHPSVLIINHLFSLSWFDHISIAGSQGTLIHINSIAGSQGTFTYFNQCSEKTEQPRSKTQALSLTVRVSTKPQNSLCLSGPNIPFPVQKYSRDKRHGKNRRLHPIMGLAIISTFRCIFCNLELKSKER